jgi:hypothetical protein
MDEPSPKPSPKKARFLTHPILVYPDSGEYIDDAEECMVVGDFKDTEHLFKSVLVKEVHDNIQALPNGPLPRANSVVIMKAEDFEKMRAKERGGGVGADDTKKRLRECRAACHAANTRVLQLDAQLRLRDERFKQILKTRDDRTKMIAYELQNVKIALAACQMDLSANKAMLAACNGELAMKQNESARLNTDLVYVMRENARLRDELDTSRRAVLEATYSADVLDLLDPARR